MKRKKSVYDHEEEKGWKSNKMNKKRQRGGKKYEWLDHAEKGKGGSMKKQILLCATFLLLDEPCLSLFLSIHLFFRALFIFGRKKRNSRWSCTKAQDTGDRTLDLRAEKNQRDGAMKSFAALLLFSLVMLVASVVIVYLCSLLKFVRPADIQTAAGNKRADFYGKAQQNSKNAWIWHSKRLGKTKKVVQIDFVFSLSGVFCQGSVT